MGIDSTILIKLLKEMSPEINQQTLPFLLLAKDNVVKNLTYGNNNTGKPYWPNHATWIKNAGDFLEYETDSFVAAGINMLELCCPHKGMEIISLEKQFNDLLEEVFSIYYDSDLKLIQPLVIRLLEESQIPDIEISRVKELTNIQLLISFLISRAKNKGIVPKDSISDTAPPNTQDADDSIKIVTTDYLTSELGMSPLEISKNLVENDYKLYPGISSLNEGDAYTWEKYILQYGSCFRYLYNTKLGKIVGNWSFLALEDSEIPELEKGKLKEKTFSPANTAFLYESGDYNLYLLNLSYNDSYMPEKYYPLLVESFFDQLLLQAHNGIFYKRLYINIFLDIHEALWKKRGFTHIIDHEHTGKIYRLEMTPYPPGLGKYQLLKEYYEKHYGN